MTTNYERGRAFEYRARDKLYADGAIHVARSAGSKSPVDLTAVYEHGVTRFVQVKKDGRLPRKERDALLALASRAHVTAWLARQGARGEGVVLERLRAEKDVCHNSKEAA